jgi:tetratricopeptide (TPR) repeat protein
MNTINASRETNDEELLYSVAHRFYQNKDFENARKVATNLIYRDPSNARYYQLLGFILQDMKEYKCAIDAHSQAFLFNPTDPKTPFACAQCCVFLKQWSEARRWAKTCQHLDANFESLGELLWLINLNSD